MCGCGSRKIEGGSRFIIYRHIAQNSMQLSVCGSTPEKKELIIDTSKQLIYFKNNCQKYFIS
jgi:hypothetical protein